MKEAMAKHTGAKTMRRTILALAIGLMAFLCPSCRYHLGQALTARSCCLTAIRNDSTEAALTPLLRQAFQTEASRRPGLRLAAEDAAEVVVELKVTGLSSRTIARSEIRDDGDKDEAYQSVLHRLTLTLEATAWRSGEDAPFLTTTLQGQADMPRLPDREMTLRPAMRLAANDAIRQLFVELQAGEEGAAQP